MFTVQVDMYEVHVYSEKEMNSGRGLCTLS
jgi:hypothetical protein